MTAEKKTYLRYTSAPCAPEANATFFDLSGRDTLINAPRRTANMALRYEHALDVGWRGPSKVSTDISEARYKTWAIYERTTAEAVETDRFGVRAESVHQLTPHQSAPVAP